MANVKLSPFLHDDAVIQASASGLTLINVGDWVIASAQWAIAADDATIGSPAYKFSALGMALEPNPTVDSQGAWINNSGLSVLTRGVIRVSAGNSGTARTIPVGSQVYPDASASGINGHTGGTTGATGVGPTWLTAPNAPRLSGYAGGGTGASLSGVAQVLQHAVGGDSGAGQIDIRFNLATQAFFS